jgi:crotonobetainyl-CoA:carnitine CoA-transferase CaiB-like acyl-CoA transferase
MFRRVATSSVALKLIANPVRLSETPPSYRIALSTWREHTDDVLKAWLGIGESELDFLRRQQVI